MLRPPILPIRLNFTKSLYYSVIITLILLLNACSTEVALIETSANDQDYTVTLEFIGEGFSDERKAIFQAAAARWSEVITSDLANVTFSRQQDDLCGFGKASFSGTLDDLHVFAIAQEIDGRGKVLGAAFPSIVRDSDELTAVGCMVFDTADLDALEANGSLANVILHEMGHVLGIGSFWQPILGFNSRRLVEYTSTRLFESCSSTEDFAREPTYVGEKAIAEFKAMGGTGPLAAEDNYGAGTQCSHWDEATFGKELMTGFSESDGDMPLSRLTIAALDDLGYDVNYDAADPYMFLPCGSFCLKSQNNESHETWEIVLPPRAKVMPDGRIIPLN